MVDLVWTSRSPLEASVVAGLSGNVEGKPGVTLTEYRGFGLVQVMARRGRWSAVADAARRVYGLDAPARPTASSGSAAALVWSGPDQFLALTPGAGLAGLLPGVASAFSGIASLSDQTGGRCLVSVSGPRARDALGKLCSVDLHEAAFAAGTAAATALDHTGVNLWRGKDGADGSAVFNLLVFSSYAESLWHAIRELSLEYGLKVQVADY